MPAVAIVTSATLAQTRDPIFTAIDTHRATHAAHLAAINEQSRLERLKGFDLDLDLTEKPCHDENDAFEILVIVAEEAIYLQHRVRTTFTRTRGSV
jgi:hypothetical protein